MTADRPAPRKKPDVTAIPHQNIINETRAAVAQQRLVNLANYVFGEGFLPDVAAVAAGFPHRAAALKAAQHAGRNALAAALRLPTPAEKRAAQIEDLEFLLDRGEWPERAVKRCGFTNLDTAINLIRRWGYNDLSMRLYAIATQYTVDEEDAA